MVTSASTVKATLPPQLSDVVTAPMLAAGTALAQETVTFAGQVIEGGVLSNTVMVWVHAAVFPQTSAAI